jgi:alkanesulfonate monooxygenase SsuD/methylene tetrahydromethanopterin reductase-like flavin-dependent oxidoreductase (luciferase family)
MVLGVGPGGPPDAEYARSVRPDDARILAERLDGGLEVAAACGRGERFSHRGRHFRADQVTFLPRPWQRPRIPVGVACT